MINLSLSELADILNLPQPVKEGGFEGLSIDTRTLVPGNLFIAIKGEQFDGHDFLNTALQKGAVAAIVDHQIDLPIPQFVVQDTVIALGKLSENWRDRFNIPFIGITGSNGKTTVKNMLASILTTASHPDQVLATKGNFNNHIGLPLTLAKLNKQHRYAVIEMGMNHFGEIAYLTQLTKPDVVIINNAATAHLAGVENLAGVARAKGEILLGLNKNGAAILNRDDEYFDYWRAQLSPNQRCLSFGLQNPADISAAIFEEINLTLPLLGTHNILNALAATAAAIAININLTAIKLGLETVKPEPGRLNQYLLPSGTRIIDDAYNANPASLHAAINTLAEFNNTKILVFGDMGELGPDAKIFHTVIGEKALAAGIDYLFTFGNLSLETKNAFGKNAFHFTDQKTLISALQPYLKNNTTILIKGSNSMGMKKIVAALVNEITT